MLKIRTLLFRLLLLLLSAIAFYYIIPFKIAEIQARLALDVSGKEDAYTRVLHWNSSENEALTNLAELAKEEGEFEKAKKYALQALSVDPTNGHATSILLFAYEKAQDEENLQKAIDIAPRQWAAHSYVHSTLADYWAGQGEIEKVLVEWDLLLTRHSGLYKVIFPILLGYANSEEGRGLLTPFAVTPSPWWKDFFIYMVNQKVSFPVLQYYYQQRVSSGVPLEEHERKAYIRKLLQTKQWKLAYSTWISGLSGTQFSLIGSIYDAGFESTSHDTGFDWNFRQSKQAKITLGRTRGIKGKRGLHIVFKKRKPIRFSHVWQRLLLEPNRTYQVTMQSRIDNLENPQGLAWRVLCADESSELLVESEPLKGSKKWHEISFEFVVPKKGCNSQIIRLEAASRYHHEHFFKGGIWFDEVSLLPKPSAKKP